MKVITKNSKETKGLGEMLASEIKNGAVVCLSGELGSGKTTFTQGFLKGLGVKGPHTSPTFVVMKQYKLKVKSPKLKVVYHLDAYRVSAKDILNLGWLEIVADEKNIILIEWAERVKKIIPHDALWIKFKWLDENRREITFSSK